MTRNLEAQDNFEIRFIQNCLHQIQNGNIEYFTSRDPSYFMQIVNKLFYFDEDSIDQIDETQKVKYNIFLFSIYKNQVKITDYLYDSGANWKQSLFLLIENNFFDKIENFCNFLERNKLNIDFLYSYKDLNMNTPLMFAYQNNKEHISSFLEKKYNRNLVLKGKKKLKFKKLYCSNENPSQIEVFEAIVGNQLINEKATNLDFHLNFENSWSPFLLAVYLKNIPITNFLKNQYVDINHKSNQNNTALHIAVLNNDFEMVRLLISYGINLREFNDQNKTALMYAGQNLSYKIFEILIAADPNQLFEINNNDKVINNILSELTLEQLKHSCKSKSFYQFLIENSKSIYKDAIRVCNNDVICKLFIIGFRVPKFDFSNELLFSNDNEKSRYINLQNKTLFLIELLVQIEHLYMPIKDILNQEQEQELSQKFDFLMMKYNDDKFPTDEKITNPKLDASYIADILNEFNNKFCSDIKQITRFDNQTLQVY